MNRFIKTGLALSMLFMFSIAVADEHRVKMMNLGTEGQMVFEPAVLEVSVGDTVIFVPTDPGHDSISVFTPPGANSWHGKRGQEVRIIINKEGVYLYKCAPHYYYGMFGVIYAGSTHNLEEAKAVAKQHSKKFLAHKDRLINYLNHIE